MFKVVLLVRIIVGQGPTLFAGHKVGPLSSWDTVPVPVSLNILSLTFL